MHESKFILNWPIAIIWIHLCRSKNCSLLHQISTKKNSPTNIFVSQFIFTHVCSMCMFHKRFKLTYVLFVCLKFNYNSTIYTNGSDFWMMHLFLTHQQFTQMHCYFFGEHFSVIFKSNTHVWADAHCAHVSEWTQLIISDLQIHNCLSHEAAVRLW